MITIPTISELYNDILADLEAEYSITIPVLGKNFLRAVAAVQAAKLKLYYLAIGNLQKNIFPDTAGPESSGGTLERFGRIKLNRNPFAAQAAQYVIEVTGEINAVIPAGTTFKSNDDSLNPGKLYILDSEYTMTAIADSITVRALESGLDSQLDIGNMLTATAPIAGVNSQAEVTSESVEPLAAETTEEYRRKVLDSFRLEPQGGATSDYRLWASEAQGVRQTYPYAKSGAANEINLFVEANAVDSTDGKGTPSSQILEDVEELVEFDPDTTKPLSERGRRPLGVFDIHYLPVVIKEVDITISSFSGLTASIQGLVETALESEINEIRPFIAGADVVEDRNDYLDTNKIISVILTVRPGSVFGAVTLSVGGVSVSSYTFDNGEIPNLNSVSFS